MFNIFIFIICYLIAAINPAIIISKLVLKQDIRELGSKNAGTTNSIRVMGKKMGAVVFLLDLLKVVLSYIFILGLANLFNRGLSSISYSLYMLASVLGHSYPIYYKFKGGKGVAVFLMTAVITDYKLALICTGVAVIVIAISRMVSLGSITGAVLLLILAIFTENRFNILILVITVLVIVFNHRENIKRIAQGKESKLF